MLPFNQEGHEIKKALVERMLNSESMFIERRPPVALTMGERPAGAWVVPAW